MIKCRYILAFTVIILFILLCACADNSEQNELSVTPDILPEQSEQTADSPDIASGRVTISFAFEHQSGWASNQFAIWVEDMDGNYINTVYATRWTAQGGYKTRPDSLALWVAKSDLASKAKYQVDAIAGATPKTGHLSYSWDLTDANGDTVSPGEYKFFVEGTLRWKNYVLYSGVIMVGGESNGYIADAEYFYEASDGQDALTSGSPENGMIFKVTANFTP